MCSIVGLTASAGQASFAVDGTVTGSEWSGSSVVATTIANNLNARFRVASTSAGMYMLAETTDDDAGAQGFDVFDINFGLVGNAAAWRYRIQSGTGPINAPFSYAITGVTGWGGRFEYGDDSIVANPSIGLPGGTYTSVAIPASIQWAVGLGNTDGAAMRVHEIFVPWSVILDGQNGWDAGASSLTFAFAGHILQDGVGSSFTDPTKHGSFGWGNQASYAAVTLAIPAPGALAVLGLAGLAGRRRR